MQRRNSLLLVLWIASVPLAMAESVAGESVVYIVRHAEKAAASGDPGLTEAGRKRAEAGGSGTFTPAPP